MNGFHSKKKIKKLIRPISGGILTDWRIIPSTLPFNITANASKRPRSASAPRPQSEASF